MDNAPYHSRRKEPIPTKIWTKVRFQEWLTSRELSSPLKQELWTIVDELATGFGKSTLLKVIGAFNFSSCI
jgi:hypothetical protein